MTISLPAGLLKEINAVAKREGLSKSDLVCESVKRSLMIRNFRTLREWALPRARAKGVYTDEDVFKIVS